MLLLPPWVVASAAPAPYGEDFVRTGAEWREGVGRWRELATASSGAVDTEPFIRQMETLEISAGPYADGLAEPLASLGRHYRQQGDYEQAVSLYRRAMHVVRINEGLKSERQIPLLRELLLCYRQAGELESLDERYDYFFHLFGEGRPPYNPARVQAALEYMRWQREALRHELGVEKRRIVALIDLNEGMLESLRLQADIPYSWRRDVSYSQLLNYYLLLQRFKPALSEQQLLTSREYMGGAQGVQSMEDQKLQSRLRSAAAQGATMLQELAVAAARAGPIEEASVKLALADWYFWNGKRQQAVAAYASVVKMLNDAGEDSLLQHWLGTPVELPDNGVFWQPELIEDEATVIVQADYDVSASGRVSGLQAQLLPGAKEQSIQGFRRKLASTLFRPRWVNGEPEAVGGLRRRYQLLK